MPSTEPISLLERPTTSISRTSFSRSVNATRPAGNTLPGPVVTRSMNSDSTRRGAHTGPPYCPRRVRVGAAAPTRTRRGQYGGPVWAPRRVLSLFIERVTTGPGRVFPAGRVAFTDREKEVLEMLVVGRSNKEIGSVLGIEERTVKAHVAKLMRKVGVQNRIALSVHAITHSLVATK